MTSIQPRYSNCGQLRRRAEIALSCPLARSLPSPQWKLHLPDCSPHQNCSGSAPLMRLLVLAKQPARRQRLDAVCDRANGYATALFDVVRILVTVDG